MECWVALKLYGGNGVLLLMFLAAAIYIVASEKDIKKKIVLGIRPLVILAGFLFPVTKIVYVALFDDGSDTYYRILWLIPMYVVIGYGACISDYCELSHDVWKCFALHSCNFLFDEDMAGKSYGWKFGISNDFLDFPGNV